MRTPLIVIAVLAVALLGLWAVAGGEDEDAPAAASRPAPVRVIAARVEELRDLRFERVPRPVPVTPAQAQREGLSNLDREYPEARRRADEEVLKLLGLIEPDADLRELTASLFGEGVAGYYDTSNERLRIVTGAGTVTRVLAEMVLSHELTHALEDQHFGLDPEDLSGTDDAALARLALVEGTATALMTEYADRYFTAEETLGGVIGSAFADTGDLPPFMQAQVIFPYLGGAEFVDELRRRAGGRWALVDTAYEFRPPASTEQVLHPRAYFGADEPAPVELAVGRLLGDGWERSLAGTWGELQTRELLVRAGGGGSDEAAAGWGGDRYELWRARAIAGKDCPAPCHDGDVLVMRWRWDTRKDEAEFAAKLRAFARDELEGRELAVARRAGTVTLAIGPSASLARRVAREG
jgi:hypothetical protein